MLDKAIQLPTVTKYGSALTEPGAEGQDASFGCGIATTRFPNRRWHETNARARGTSTERAYCLRGSWPLLNVTHVVALVEIQFPSMSLSSCEYQRSGVLRVEID